MIQLGSVYLIVKDFRKSLAFYCALLEKNPSAQNKERFAVFQAGNLTLCLLNGYFDSEHPEEVVFQGKREERFDDTVKIAERENCGKAVINLGTDDLRREYERIRGLKLGENLTEIRYLNAGCPYWYFAFTDPDGNSIEITGEYSSDINL